MKIIAYMALHYGLDYIEAAIRSVIDSVDEFHVLYAAQPSHGSRSGLMCPDSENDLHAAAWQAAGVKLHWHYGDWRYENDQRNSIHHYVPDADAIVIVDSDEVYQDGMATDAIQYGLSVGCRSLRLPFTHMWRAFNKGFAHDPAYPTRVVFPKQMGEAVTLPSRKRIWHYGYAQRSEVVRYKVMSHGHLNEFRKDCNWFHDIFMANRQFDCHPIGSEWWNVEPIDLTRLPAILNSHPYRHLELIP